MRRFLCERLKHNTIGYFHYCEITMFLFFRSCANGKQSAKTKRKNERDLLFLSADQQTKHLNKSSRAFRVALNTHDPSVKYYYLHEVATLFISFVPFFQLRIYFSELPKSKRVYIMYRTASCGKISSIISQNIVITLLQYHFKLSKRHFWRCFFFKPLIRGASLNTFSLRFQPCIMYDFRKIETCVPFFFAQVNFTLTRNNVGERAWWSWSDAFFQNLLFMRGHIKNSTFALRIYAGEARVRNSRNSGWKLNSRN